MSTTLDLGHGLTATFYCDGPKLPSEPEHGDVWRSFDAGRDCGVTLWRGEDLVGEAPFRSSRGGPTWMVVQREPLTLSPSLLCQPANLHGFVQEGRWVPA